MPERARPDNVPGYLPSDTIKMMTPDIAQTLHPYRQFLVAFSGGLDSTVLLHQLVCWRERDPTLQLRAIHIHHGLQAAADAWPAHCQSVCDALLLNDIFIEHACEKSCACTTCHVVVRDGFNSLEPAEELEEDLLDKAWGLEPNSRLSCQAVVAGTPPVELGLEASERPVDADSDG